MLALAYTLPLLKYYKTAFLQSLLSCIVLLVSYPVNAQQYDYAFEHITAKDGLSQNNINCILQDRNGFMWFGTDDGLNRYDGYDFVTYNLNSKTQYALSSNIIMDLVEDIDHNIWIGTSHKGLNLFNYQSARFNDIEAADFNKLNMDIFSTLTDIKSDSLGNVYLICHTKVLKLSKTNKTVHITPITFFDFENKPIENISTISNMGDTLMLGTDKGAMMMKKTLQGNYVPIENKWIIVTNVKEIIQNGEEYIVAGGGGIYITDGSNHLAKFEGVRCMDVILGKNKHLWVATTTGLLLYTPDTATGRYKLSRQFTKGDDYTSISSNKVKCLYEDRFGVVWIGTIGGGISRLDQNKNRFRHYKGQVTSSFIKNNKIRTIYEDPDQNVWFGTEVGGLSLLPFAEKDNYTSGIEDIAVHKGGPTSVFSINGLHEAGQSKVIASTDFYRYNRIYAYDHNSKYVGIELMPAKVMGLPVPTVVYKSDGDHLWIGTYEHGLYRYSFSQDSLVSYEGTNLSSNIIRSIVKDSRQRLWIGTANGLNMLTLAQQRSDKPTFQCFHHLPYDTTTIGNDYILPIYESTDQEIWVGTMGGGLNRFVDTDCSFERVDVADGLPSNVVNNILEDDEGNLWLGSNRGVTKFSPKTRYIKNFDLSDGLQDFEFSEMASCKRKSGEMLFGGNNGFNAFYPKEIRTSPTPPKVELTALYVLNQRIATGEMIRGRVLLSQSIQKQRRITLKHTENSFSIYFTAFHANNPQKYKYKYQLAGFDKQWIITSSQYRFANYTSIAPGKYQFKVLASNGDGIWAQNPLVLEITILPPFWASWYAVAAYLALLLLVMWFFRRFSIIKSKKKEELLLKHFERDKAEELTQVKLRFFTDLSHEFRTPLTLIMGYAQTLLNNNKAMQTDGLANSIHILHRNANILLRLVNQLMDFRKFESGKMRLQVQKTNINLLANQVAASFRIAFKHKKINFTLVCDNTPVWLWVDQEKVGHILYNLLSNAAKYTPENGMVTFSIRDMDGRVKIEVKDSGIGIPTAEQPRVFERYYQASKAKPAPDGSTGIGLSFSKGLVEMHHGTIGFLSQEGKGTTFWVSFLKGKAHLNSQDILNEHPPMGSMPTAGTPLTEVPDGGKDTTTTLAEPAGKPEIILVVEDHYDLRTFLSQQLSKTYQVITAANGLQGLESCLHHTPDLVISDVMMPQMDGYELCRKIKGDERVCHIPVILLTAKTDSVHQVKGFEEGANAYISKPFNFEVLQAQAESIFKHRRVIWEKFNTAFPQIGPNEMPSGKDKAFLEKVNALIEENLPDSAFTVEQLAAHIGMTQRTLGNKLKALTGQTPKRYLSLIRLNHAAMLLQSGAYTVSEITYKVGFNDLQHFRLSFKKQFGHTPSEYKKLKGIQAT